MTLRLLFILNCFHLTPITAIAQTLSLNEQVNNYVDSVISNMPPKIYFSFFLNGRQIKHDLSFSANIKGTTKSIQCKDSLLLPESYFSLKDSIFFDVVYSTKKLIPTQIQVNQYLHGGTVVFNLITNYKKQLKNYLKDSTNFFNSNHDNYLYRLFQNRRWKYQNDQNGNFYYIIIKSNTTPFTTYLDGKL